MNKTTTKMTADTRMIYSTVLWPFLLYLNMIFLLKDYPDIDQGAPTRLAMLDICSVNVPMVEFNLVWNGPLPDDKNMTATAMTAATKMMYSTVP